MPASVGAGDLGRYRLDRLLGAGGMGEVYLARDSVLPRDVAIKFLSSGETDPGKLQRQLIREAQAVAALDHPAICVVHDVGVEASGRPFMVMQYVEGETLAARLARGPLPVRDALALCARIADALGAAHRRAIIHRDLKPQNVMITPSGAPKLLDFGIAKVLSAVDAAGASAETATRVTESNAFAGTPSYMSPEQVQQRPLDARSDLFSLGCILYECLTGRRPFAGAQTIDVLAQILHAHPPAPSSLRGELDERHDELIRRLLAKEPADRFQSADELVGALRVLQPDTSRQSSTGIEAAARRWTSDRGLRRAASGVAIALALSVTGFAVWRWSHPGLPVAPPDAERYYTHGTDALREGAYNSAAAALTEAVRIYPAYAVAQARLAEAQAAIGDDSAAAQTLLRVSETVPDTARLPPDEQLRLQAIRSSVLADADAAVTSYTALAQRHANDASVWVDLGRAQEAAARVADAQASFERAIALDPGYATAHLRLGAIHGLQGRRDAALAAFAEAERIYRATSNREGEIEVRLARGSLFDTGGEYDAAQTELSRALTTASAIGNPFQMVRAKMALSVVAVSQSQIAQAESLASEAVKAALDSGLDATAADGLIDLGAVLIFKRDLPQAETQLRKAIAIARQRGAKRIEARAVSQIASLQLSDGHPAEAVKTVQSALDFFRERKYRRLELTALSIAARGYQQIDDVARAGELGARALKEAEATGDRNQLSLALTNLAGQATARGALPEALALRERVESIHRGQHDVSSLPYDLTNRAELLIRLGRFDEAEAAMKEVDAGAAQKLAVYVGRGRRVRFLRALAAVTEQRLEAADAMLAAIPLDASTDAASALTPVLKQYVDARRGRRTLGAPVAAQPADIAPAVERDRDYWRAAAALARGEHADAFRVSTSLYTRSLKIGNDELAWRCAALASAAAGPSGHTAEQQSYRSSAAEILTRLRSAWGDGSVAYEHRPDLVELRKAARL